MISMNILSDGPYFGLALTILVYWSATALWQRSGRSALIHPILVSTVVISGILLALDLGYETYSVQTRPLSLGLGLVVVMLAVPLVRNRFHLLALLGPCTVALTIGSVVSVVTALALPLASGAGPDLLATLLPKATTAGVAVGISEHLGGLPGLTAVIVIGTGIAGAVLGPAVLDRTGVTDDRARGFALGVASHAIGTARALQISDTAGAFAALGMVLNAILTVLAAPFIMQVIGL
jgi:predicted murein hydrolase (TIGR00659 family)